MQPIEQAAPSIADLHKQIVDVENLLTRERERIRQCERDANRLLTELNELQKKFDAAVDAARKTAVRESEWGRAALAVHAGKSP